MSRVIMLKTATTLLLLVAAAAAVPGALWWSTTERHVHHAAAAVVPQATANDLVILDARLSPNASNPAGLTRPFGPLATVVLEPNGPLPDLTTFPQSRAFVVGDLDAAALGLTNIQPVAPRTVVGTVVHQGVPVVAMVERIMASVEKDGVVRPCTGRHPSGGVRCGNQGWQYVGAVVVPARNRNVACVWTHPIHQHVLHLDVPTGAGEARLWMQFADEALRDAPHPPVDVVVTQQGATLANVACLNQQEGRCVLTVPAAQAGTLRVSISTADAARQLVCLGGEVPTP